MTFTAAKARAAVDRAFQFAVERHTGQTDKLGAPYTLHVTAVASGVLVGDDEDVEGWAATLCAAVLHDAVEDGVATWDEIEDLDLPSGALAALRLLTKRSGESYDSYIKRLVSDRSQAHRIALRVKRADLQHNTRRDRLAQLDPATQERLVTKYAPARVRVDYALHVLGEPV